MQKVLVIIDVQNDFCEGGPLAVAGSSQIFSVINSLKKSNFFSEVIITKDWHPSDHVSFASSHNKKPFTKITLPNGVVQELWPDHCVANSYGAQLSRRLETDGHQLIVFKGFNKDTDSYSGFMVSQKGIELKNELEKLKADEVYVCGLAFDFCVGSTALDSRKFGYKTFVVEQGTKSVGPQTEKIMKKRLQQAQVEIISYKNIVDK